MSPLRRWVTTIAVGILAAALCVTAGVWQWQRHVARSERADVVAAHQAARPGEPPAAGEVVGPDRLWEPVALTGRYLGDPVLLRNRPVDGRQAFHVLGAVEVTKGPTAGSVLVVARGWLPAGDDAAAPDHVPPPPAGEVDLVVNLLPEETAATRAAPAGQVHTVAVDQVRAAAIAAGLAEGAWPASATVTGYGVLASEDGAAPAGLGRLPAPDTGLGSHLSYAFQWWVFAAGALVGSVLLVVRERRDLAAAAPGPDGAPPAAQQRPTRSRRPTAEEQEDAILDAQGL